MRARPRLPFVCAAAAVLVAAAPAPAPGGERLAPARKLFPYLDLYLRIPPAERDVFALSYRVRENGGPPRNVRMIFVADGRHTPAPLDAEGRLERLPTLEEWRGQVALEGPPGTRFGLNMRMGCTGGAGRELAADRLVRCVAQYRAAVGRAGPLSLLAPRLDRVALPGAGSGEVVLAGGVRRPLPLEGGHPVFEPAAWRGATSVVLDRPPSGLYLDGASKRR